MRTRNTYVALLLALGAGTALTVVGCSPDTTVPPISLAAPDPRITLQKVEDLRAKYGWVGKYHTDGLGYVYRQLAKSGNKVNGRDDACRIATMAIKEFHKAAGKGEVPAGMVGTSFDIGECIPASGVAPIRGTILSGPSASAPRHSLSGAAVGYLDRLGAVPDNSNSSFEYANQVTAIEFEAAANLPEDEAGAVTAVASVAISSATYWEQNLDSWAGLPGTLPLPYARNAGGTLQSIGVAPGKPVYAGAPRWWSNPAVVGFRRVLSADIMAGGRTAYLAWALGPVALDAVAASALWGSATTGVILLF